MTSPSLDGAVNEEDIMARWKSDCRISRWAFSGLIGKRERDAGREKGKKGDEKHLRLGRFVRSATSVCCERKQRIGQERIALDE